jgi:hypothetical protein
MIHFLLLKYTPDQAILSELEDFYGKDVISLPGHREVDHSI